MIPPLPTDGIVSKLEKSTRKIADLDALRRWNADLTNRVAIAQLKWDRGLLSVEERDDILAEAEEYRTVAAAFLKKTAGGFFHFEASE